MAQDKLYDVIIVGGSYAGLSAAMTLGRSVRDTMIIDNGKSCNRFTPHSHNFLTHDGSPPAAIRQTARAQVAAYPTVSFEDDTVVRVENADGGFSVETSKNARFNAKKILFATGLVDEVHPVPGLSECWGKSALHCPYCHGYEVRHQPTGIIANGELAVEFTSLIRNWTNKLYLFTNGQATLTSSERESVSNHVVQIIESPLLNIEHENGMMRRVHFENGSSLSLNAIYLRAPFRQQSDQAEKLGCTLTKNGLIEVDAVQRTTVPGVYAAGDNSSMMRAVAIAVSSGMMAGAMINKELIQDKS